MTDPQPTPDNAAEPGAITIPPLDVSLSLDAVDTIIEGLANCELPARRVTGLVAQLSVLKRNHVNAVIAAAEASRKAAAEKAQAQERAAQPAPADQAQD